MCPVNEKKSTKFVGSLVKEKNANVVKQQALCITLNENTKKKRYLMNEKKAQHSDKEPSSKAIIIRTIIATASVRSRQ